MAKRQSVLKLEIISESGPPFRQGEPWASVGEERSFTLTAISWRCIYECGGVGEGLLGKRKRRQRRRRSRGRETLQNRSALFTLSPGAAPGTEMHP